MWRGICFRLSAIGVNMPAKPLGIDSFTADTLMQMIRYVSSDSRIARHLDIPECRVAQARNRLPKEHRMSSRNVRRAIVVAQVRHEVATTA